MDYNIIRRHIWNDAAKAGLALGLVSSAYLLIMRALGNTGETPVFPALMASFVLWAGKFAGCIYLMLFFMKKFAADNQVSDQRILQKFGYATALLSAIIYAGVSFADIVYISPELVQEQMQAMMQNYSALLDSNSANMMEKMMHEMPKITFFSNLIYCFAYGSVLSSIISRMIRQ